VRKLVPDESVSGRVYVCELRTVVIRVRREARRVART
jgi:hypothetical protein